MMVIQTFNNQKGFTLLELLVAITIILLVTIALVVMLLKHIENSKVAVLYRDINSIKIAVDSALSKNDLKDTNGDGDYLKELVSKGYLNKIPMAIPGADYKVLKTTNVNGTSVYYLEIECTNEECLNVIRELDKKIDNSDGPNAGEIQWIN